MATIKEVKFYHGPAWDVDKELAADLNREEVAAYKVMSVSAKGAIDIVSLMVIYDIKVAQEVTLENIMAGEESTAFGDASDFDIDEPAAGEE